MDKTEIEFLDEIYKDLVRLMTDCEIVDIQDINLKIALRRNKLIAEKKMEEYDIF